MRVAMGNRKRVPGEDVPIKSMAYLSATLLPPNGFFLPSLFIPSVTIQNDSNKTVTGVQAHLAHVLKVKRKKAQVSTMGVATSFQPPEFPLKKGENPKYEGFMTFTLPSNLNTSSPTSYYEVQVECLLDDKSTRLVAPLVVDVIVETKN